MESGTPKLGSQSIKVRSFQLYGYEVAVWWNEDVYEVTNSYTKKGMICLNKNLVEWLYSACEENLRLGLMGARA